jgi:hypothetical protein
MLRLWLRPRNPEWTIADPGPLFAPDGISRLESHSEYRVASPFPHLILDALFNPEALRAVLREWPISSDADEKNDDGTYVRKKVGTTWKTPLGPRTKRYFAELAGPAFLKTLEMTTGISGLMPDPYMFGGGLHATASGGKLAVHADYNRHPSLRIDRRLNLLVYLNEGWTEANGGWLELWDREMKQCVRRALPVFNRTVLFSTTSTSFHGQPEPVMGPPDLWRKSIALYYFSNGRPEEGQTLENPPGHSTLWQERPAQGF